MGIDFRPKPPVMRLYALANTGQLYLISDPNSGVATAVGPGPAPMLSGSEFGVDFNPTVDRIRVVSNANQNLRMHPDTGALAATDMNLNYAAGDPNQGVTPQVAAGAYTNNFDGAPSTVLNDIDTGLDILATQNPPNNGTLNTVGSLGVRVGGEWVRYLGTDQHRLRGAPHRGAGPVHPLHDRPCHGGGLPGRPHRLCHG